MNVPLSERIWQFVIIFFLFKSFFDWINACNRCKHPNCAQQANLHRLNQLISANFKVPVHSACSADRFMAIFFPVTSASSISRICGNKSLLGYPDYVTVSLRRQAFDTDKRTVAAAEAAAGLRGSGSVASSRLSSETR